MKSILFALMMIVSGSAMADLTDCTGHIPKMPIHDDQIKKAIVCYNVFDVEKLKQFDCNKLVKSGALPPEICKSAGSWVTGELVDCTFPVLAPVEILACGSVIDPDSAQPINCQDPAIVGTPAFEICKKIDVDHQLMLLKQLK